MNIFNQSSQFSQILGSSVGRGRVPSSQSVQPKVAKEVNEFLKQSCKNAGKTYVLQVVEGKLYATHDYGTKHAHSHELLDLSNGGRLTNVSWTLGKTREGKSYIKTEYTENGSFRVGEVPMDFLFGLADQHDH